MSGDLNSSATVLSAERSQFVFISFLYTCIIIYYNMMSNSSYDVLVDAIHKSGVEYTEYLQKSLLDVGDFMVWVSIAFEPAYTYTLYFPLIFPLLRKTGLQVLWATAIAEWLNHVFKWILLGERPYWWVLENKLVWEVNNVTVPQLLQFPNSCETGPGSPSGHVMINGTLLFVFVNGILEKTRKKWLHFIGWMLYAVCLSLIAISRVFIAAHFPHQCIAGLLSGVALGYILCKVPVMKMGIACHLGIATCMAAIAMTVYFVILKIGIDPNWTIALAQKWCSNPKWVHLSTNLFYMFWRYMGTVIGIGFGLSSKFYSKSSASSFGDARKLVLLLLGIFTVMALKSIIYKGNNVNLVYSSAFAVHLVVPYVVISLLPWSLLKITGKLPLDKKRQ